MGSTMPKSKRRTGNTLTDKEREQMEKRRGLTAELAGSLARFWNMSENSIEVGHSVINADGATTHIVQFMKKKRRVPLAPWLVIRRFYEKRTDELNAIFREHFGLNDHFQVFFQLQYQTEGNTAGSIH